MLLSLIDNFLLYQKSLKNSPRTRQFYSQKLIQFVHYLEEMGYDATLENTTTDQIRRYLVWLEETGHNPGGCHAAFRALKAMLYWYEGEYELEGWKNPIRHKIKAPKVPEVILDPIEKSVQEKLLATCKSGSYIDDRDRAIMLLLLSTGVRANELVQMNIEDVTWPLRKITVKHGKGNKQRSVFFDKPAARALRGYLKHRGSPETGPLFDNILGERLLYGGLRMVLESRIKKAGLSKKGLMLHAFRRTFGINRIRAGAGEMATARLLGHTTTAIVHKYAKQDDNDLKKAHDLELEEEE
jgi:integrase/recombinase XerD